MRLVLPLKRITFTISGIFAALNIQLDIIRGPFKKNTVYRIRGELFSQDRYLRQGRSGDQAPLQCQTRGHNLLHENEQWKTNNEVQNFMKGISERMKTVYLVAGSLGISSKKAMLFAHQLMK